MAGKIPDSLVGEVVTLVCVNYIYTGYLEEVSEYCARLNPAFVVYQTGEHDVRKPWLDKRPFPGEWFVALDALESFGRWKVDLNE